MHRAIEPSCRARSLLRLLVAGALASSAGCAGRGEQFLPVRGKVTLNGKPLTFGAVSFRPDAARGNRSQHHPTGRIEGGQFELHTLRRKGAPPGWYKVLVFADENQESGPLHPALPRWATDVKYTREETTDLSVEVVDKPAPGAYDLTLTR
jgi:hypothetical protein